MISYAQRYRRVITWLDKGEKAKAKMDTIPCAYGVKSPQGKDANDLLQSGMLGGFLAIIRFQACRDKEEMTGLYYDLLDAASLTLNGVNEWAISAIEHIQRTLMLAKEQFTPAPMPPIAPALSEDDLKVN